MVALVACIVDGAFGPSGEQVVVTVCERLGIVDRELVVSVRVDALGSFGEVGVCRTGSSSCQ